MRETGPSRADVKPNGLVPARPVERRRKLFRPGPRRPPVVAEFQSDATEVEHQAPPRLARLTLYGVLALIAFAATWASVSQVEMIVTAQGQLTTTRPNLVVQPLGLQRGVGVGGGGTPPAPPPPPPPLPLAGRGV